MGYVETERNTGLVETRRCRKTNGLISIYRAEEALIDADTTYVLVCEWHGALLDAPSLTYARKFRPHPDEWCDFCRVRLDRQNAPG